MSTSSKISNIVGEDEQQQNPPINTTLDSKNEPAPTPSPPDPSTAVVDEAQMATTQSKDSAPSPSWFTPKRYCYLFFF